MHFLVTIPAQSRNHSSFGWNLIRFIMSLWRISASSKQMAHNTTRLELLRVITEPNPNPYFCSRCTCYRVLTMKSIVPVGELCRTIPDRDVQVGVGGNNSSRTGGQAGRQVQSKGFITDC